MNSSKWIINAYSVRKALIKSTALDGIWYVNHLPDKGHWLVWSPDLPGKLIEVDDSAMIFVTYLD